MLSGALLANAALMKLSFAINRQSQFVRSYEHLGTLLFGKKGQIFTGIVVHGTIGACSASLLILIGASVQRLCNFPGDQYRALTVLGASLPLLPLAWIKNMHEASYVALVGTLAVFALAGIIVLAGFFQVGKHGVGGGGSGGGIVPLQGSISSFMSAVAVCVFSFNTANTAPSLIHDMRTPQAFGKTVAVAASLIFAIYLAISLAGYLGWGASIQDYDTVVNLVLGANGEDAKLDTLGYFCAITVLLLAYPHYVVLLVPVATAAETAIASCMGREAGRGRGGMSPRMFSILVRSMMWGLTVGFAAAAKSFDNVVGIVAGIAMPFIAILLPIVFYWKTKNNLKETMTILDLGLNSLIFAVGSGLLLNGIYDAGHKISKN